MTRDLDIAWAAGFLEGEGCFGTYGKGHGSPMVAASQINIEPLERLKKIFPEMTLRETSPSSAGNRTWECRCYGDKAISIMREVLPWMSEKKAAQIIDAIEQREQRAADVAERLKTCPQGHNDFGFRPGNGYRYCKTCQREYAQAKRKVAA